MVYTDGSHLIADSKNELHTFAASIGLKRCWFQNKKGKNHPHYDITSQNIINRALNNGALRVSSKQIIEILKNISICQCQPNID
jgi:hypothetical protein